MQVEINQGSGRVWDSFARSLGGGRPKVSITRPSASEPIEQGCVSLLPDRVGSLKGLLDTSRFRHRPNLLRFDYTGFKDKKGFKILQGFNPVCPQRGPYEASEGI